MQSNLFNILPARTEKTTKNLSQDRGCSGRNSNGKPLGYKSETLRLWSSSSVGVLGINVRIILKLISIYGVKIHPVFM
jgi:hypothetical protein